MCFVLAISFAKPKAQQLPSSRIIDWTTSGLDSATIPLVWDTVDVTSSAVGLDSSGTFDNHSLFQAALNNFALFPNPTVFYFPSGRYIFNTVINVPGSRILQGASSESTTFLSFTKTHCFTIGRFQLDTAREVISGNHKSSKTLTLSSVAGLKPEMYLDLYQANDSTKMETTNPTTWNQVWAKDSKGLIVKIVSVDTITNSITLQTELPVDLDDLSGNGYVRLQALPMTEFVGFQDFKLSTQDSTMQGHSFYFRQVGNSWICGIESSVTRKYHVALERCANMKISGSYFHHSYNYGGGGSGYGVECGFHTSRVLVVNNIFNNLRHSILLHLGANSNVYAYNYSLNPFWSQFGTPADLVLHGHYPTMNLFEGNIVQQITAADYWGPSGPGNTFLRNRIENKHFSIADRSHNQNLIANELPGPNVIGVASGVKGTIIHANTIAGTTTYDTSFSQNISPSFYFAKKPCFLDTIKFPPIGPKYAYGTYTIPAKKRFSQSRKTAPCKCTSSLSSSLSSLKRVEVRHYFDAQNAELILWIDEAQLGSDVEIYDLRGRLVQRGRLREKSNKLKLISSISAPFFIKISFQETFYSRIIVGQ